MGVGGEQRGIDRERGGRDLPGRRDRRRQDRERAALAGAEHHPIFQQFGSQAPATARPRHFFQGHHGALLGLRPDRELRNRPGECQPDRDGPMRRPSWSPRTGSYWREVDNAGALGDRPREKRALHGSGNRMGAADRGMSGRRAVERLQPGSQLLPPCPDSPGHRRIQDDARPHEHPVGLRHSWPGRRRSARRFPTTSRPSGRRPAPRRPRSPAAPAGPAAAREILVRQIGDRQKYGHIMMFPAPLGDE